jgi:hypothetical protein
MELEPAVYFLSHDLADDKFCVTIFVATIKKLILMVQSLPESKKCNIYVNGIAQPVLYCDKSRAKRRGFDLR